MTTTDSRHDQVDPRTEGRYDERLLVAVTELLARRAGLSHTPGNYAERRVVARGWHPDPSERRDCCPPLDRRVDGIRSHLRGAQHVASVYAVSVVDLRAAAACATSTSGV